MSKFQESDLEDCDLHSSPENSGNKISAIDLDDNNDLIQSDSKIPLKTPLNDDENLQLKFSINDAANGRGKCIAECAIPSFSGLSKEELLRYANDPFWIRVRLLLFIFFWAIWIILFVGAIAIIVLAPKCEPPKKPEWYEQGPLYEVDVEKFIDIQQPESYLQKMRSKLEYISNLKIKGIILSPIFKVDNNKEENVLDFKAIDEKYGTLDDFEDLIKDAKEKNINIILSFVPNHSSNKHLWFNKSIAREEPYDKYYVWAPASGVTSNGSKLPPNNWLSVSGGSAWEWVEKRNEFYLHQFNADQPDLNYHNPLVLEEFKNIFSFWMDLGVGGFNLDKVQYLLEDVNLQNESPNGKPGAVHTQYEFYSHGKTHNMPDITDILTSWRQIIHRNPDKNGVLIVTGDIPVPTDSNATTVVVDIIRSDKLLKNLPRSFSAADLYSRLQKILNSKKQWPSIQLGDRYMKRVAALYGEENVDGLNMITQLLPATPIVFFGEELGMSDSSNFNWGNNGNGASSQINANESHYKVFEALVKARDTQTVLYGNTNLKILNESVLVITRVNLGNPGYLVAYNPSSRNVTVSFSDVEFVPNDLMLYSKGIATSLNIEPGQDKIKSDNVLLKPRSAAAFTFAPKTNE